jgi:hypothetical protein
MHFGPNFVPSGNNKDIQPNLKAMKKFLIAAFVLASAGVYAQSATPSCCQKAAGTTPSCSSAGASKTEASCHDKAGVEKAKPGKGKKAASKAGKKSDVAVVERRIEIRDNLEGPIFFLNGEELPNGIPSNKARLGVVGFENAPDIAGAMVKEVVPVSTAAALGLRPGDVIFQFDDKTIGSFQDLVGAMEAKMVGDKVSVKYRRDGNPGEASAYLIPSSSLPMSFSMGLPLDLNPERGSMLFEREEMRR